MPRPNTAPRAAAPAPTSAFDAEFTLKDSDGSPHSYQIVCHQATDGQDLMWALIALGAEPITRLLDVALASDDLLGKVRAALTDSSDDDAPDDWRELAAIVKALDLARVGKDIRSALVATDMTPLVRRILHHTFRDGKPMRDDIAFGAAYRRNYVELQLAIWEAVKVNRFLPLPGTT